MEVRFDIASEPVPASRPRVTHKGHAFYPKKHTTYHEFLKTYLKERPEARMEGPVAATLVFVMPPYKTSSHPVHRSDLDNLSKLPMDAITQSKTEEGEPKFWVDDCFVVHLEAYKRFAREGEEPHTKIKITPISEPVEDYVDRKFNE